MDLLIGDVFRNAARSVPERVAVAHGTQFLTFRVLNRRANQAARAFELVGVRKGDVVLVSGATQLDVVVVFAALAKLGGVFTPINPSLGGRGLDAVLDVAQPKAIAADVAATAALIEPARSRGLSVLPLGELATGDRDPSNYQAAGISEQDPHVAFFTSGSTGVPKAGVLSHRVSFLRTHPGALPEPRGAMVCPYPLFHMAAWTIALQQWQARDTVVLLDAADAASICAAVARHRATRLNCIPAVWRRILAYVAEEEHAADLATLRFADTGTSATPLELLSAIEAIVPNASVRVFYGSTEAGSVAVLEQADFRRKPGSCGVPGPSVEVRIGEGNELHVRGPLLFEGYLNDAVATEDALDEGWYGTGDEAEVDADGYITIVGRVHDVIRTGGEAVAPAEVESALANHPAIDDVAVIGMTDATWGEVVCAVVVVNAGHTAPTVEELRIHCDVRLAPYKQPRRVAVVERIPRTPSTGQVQRRLLAEQVA